MKNLTYWKPHYYHSIESVSTQYSEEKQSEDMESSQPTFTTLPKSFLKGSEFGPLFCHKLDEAISEARREEAASRLASLQDYACERDERDDDMKKFYVGYLRFLQRFYNKTQLDEISRVVELMRLRGYRR